jgi:hypothetical protein
VAIVRALAKAPHDARADRQCLPPDFVVDAPKLTALHNYIGLLCRSRHYRVPSGVPTSTRRTALNEMKLGWAALGRGINGAVEHRGRRADSRMQQDTSDIT